MGSSPSTTSRRWLPQWTGWAFVSCSPSYLRPTKVPLRAHGVLSHTCTASEYVHHALCRCCREETLLAAMASWHLVIPPVQTTLIGHPFVGAHLHQALLMYACLLDVVSLSNHPRPLRLTCDANKACEHQHARPPPPPAVPNTRA